MTETRRRIIVAVGRHLHRRTPVHVEVPQVQPFVRVSNLLAVRRPQGCVEIRRRIAQNDLLHRLRARLIGHVQGILAGLIRKIGDRFPVGRPRRIALGHGRRPRQIADIAFLFRNGKNFTTGFEHGSRAGRRNRGILNLVANLLVVRPRCWQVAGDSNAYLFRFAARGIKKIDPAKLFIDQRVRPR